MGNIAEILTLPLYGILSDRFAISKFTKFIINLILNFHSYGRRKLFLIAFTVGGAIGFLQSFSPNYTIFAIAQFIGATISSGIYMTIYLLAIELTGPKARSFAGATVHFIFSMAQVLIGITALFVHNFRTLMLIFYGLTFVSIPFVWFLPESTRWLMQKRKFAKAQKVFERMAKINKLNLSPETQKILTENINLENVKLKPNDEKKKSTSPLVSALKSKVIVFRLLTFCCCFVAINFIYFGLNVHSVRMGGNKYLNFTLLNLAEPPGVLVAYYLMQKMGRKYPLCGFMIVCSVACIASEMIPAIEYGIYYRLILLIIGKFAVTLAFTVIFMYASEMFPTNLRQSCLNVCQTFGRFACILAPQIPLMVCEFISII